MPPLASDKSPEGLVSGLTSYPEEMGSEQLGNS